MDEARAVAAETARASYGRLLAWLSSRSNDVAAAEDALSEAFRAALETWPVKGVPRSPEAWLLTAARRKLIDRSRRSKTESQGLPALTLAAEEAEAATQRDADFPDERLKLLFICAHPAIDSSVRSALMLQTVLGLDAARIASAFLVSPAAMNGRLVRAKRKIKTAAIPFSSPDLQETPNRLGAVLEAIYGAFGAGWDDINGAGGESADMSGEAIYLARLITKLLPDEAEGWGLLSLMLHAEARRNARRVDGRYVPLADQDTTLWDHKAVAEAEKALAAAWRIGKPGPYQIEAAIQSAHAAGRLTGRDVTGDITLLYEQLLILAPTIGAQVGYAAALCAADRAADAISHLDGISPERIGKYQSYWAVRAHACKLLNLLPEAEAAYDQAIGLTADAAMRAYLQQQKSMLNRRDA